MGEPVGVLDKMLNNGGLILPLVDSSTGAINNLQYQGLFNGQEYSPSDLLEMVQEIFMQKYG